MARPSLEVADVFAAHADAFIRGVGRAVSWARRRVLNQLIACRTSLLGGHVERCNECDYERVSYNSCRNRHCPKCQATAPAQWLDARAKDLLDVEYFHVVFTVPPPIAQIALQNKKVMYNILFRASTETLKTIAADPKHLGAEIGFLSVLHTWGQNLMHHPHIHCVVPGGGLSPDGTKWISCPAGFFLPVRVLSAVFRGKLLEMTRRAFAAEELAFQGKDLKKLNGPAAFEAHLRTTLSKNWVVYAKRPFGGPEQVLKYLANYTHRVAISNHRLCRCETAVSDSAYATTPTATASASWHWMPWSSSGVSCSTPCRVDSSASGTSACWRTPVARTSSLDAENSSAAMRRCPTRLRTPGTRTPRSARNVRTDICFVLSSSLAPRVQLPKIGAQL